MILHLLKLTIRPFGDIWCLIVHNFIMNKHKMNKAYEPYECQKCGRKWQL